MANINNLTHGGRLHHMQKLDDGELFAYQILRLPAGMLRKVLRAKDHREPENYEEAKACMRLYNAAHLKYTPKQLEKVHYNIPEAKFRIIYSTGAMDECKRKVRNWATARDAACEEAGIHVTGTRASVARRESHWDDRGLASDHGISLAPVIEELDGIEGGYLDLQRECVRLRQELGVAEKTLEQKTKEVSLLEESNETLSNGGDAATLVMVNGLKDEVQLWKAKSASFEQEVKELKDQRVRRAKQLGDIVSARNKADDKVKEQARKIKKLEAEKKAYREAMENMDNKVRTWILKSSHVANGDVPEAYQMPMEERLQLSDHVLNDAMTPAKRRLSNELPEIEPSKTAKVTPGSETAL